MACYIFSILSFFNFLSIFKDISINERKFNQASFYNHLKQLIKTAPIIHGHPRVILSMANKGMITMAKNFICSQRLTNMSSNNFIFVATDKPTYLALSPLSPSVIYFPSNLSQNAVNNQQIKKFYNFLHLRTKITLELLKLGCDVIVSDIDVVFFSDLTPLFNYKAELEAQHDSKDIINPMHTIPAPWKLNLGFHMWHSNNISIEMVNRILSMMIKMPKNHDQSVLRRMTKDLPMRWDSDILNVNISLLINQNNAIFHVRTLDGLLAVNPAAVFGRNSEKWRTAAKEANVTHPILIHFFHIGSYEEKINVAKTHGLWFEQFGKCSKKLPSGASWPFWD